jgi:NADH-quinone oxidoreductase subunit J
MGTFMTAEQIIFLMVSGATLTSAVLVVTVRNLVHAALWLVATLFGVAVIFALLNAGFIAVVQVVVYIGAIAILFIFAVMLTRKDLRDNVPQLNKNWWAGALVAVATFAGLFFLLQSWSAISKTAASIPPGFDAVGLLGDQLVSPDAYVLPFEVASVLLLAAMVGAVYVAFSRK